MCFCKGVFLVIFGKLREGKRGQRRIQGVFKTLQIHSEMKISGFPYFAEVINFLKKYETWWFSKSVWRYYTTCFGDFHQISRRVPGHDGYLVRSIWLGPCAGFGDFQGRLRGRPSGDRSTRRQGPAEYSEPGGGVRGGNLPRNLARNLAWNCKSSKNAMHP